MAEQAVGYRPVDASRSVMHLAWQCEACGTRVDVLRTGCPDCEEEQER